MVGSSSKKFSLGHLNAFFDVPRPSSSTVSYWILFMYMEYDMSYIVKNNISGTEVKFSSLQGATFNARGTNGTVWRS